mgnify:CR=1 FL=1
MGRWFANFLVKEGQEVIITGRNQNKLLEAKHELGVEVATNAEAVKGADVVLLSVPIDNFAEVVEHICPYTHPEQVIVDITSVKAFAVETMHKHIKTGLVLGVHPLFGPGANGVDNQNFVLTPTNDSEETIANKIKKYLEVRGARVTLMNPQEHDEMMAVILGLSHFITLVAADTLLSFGKLEQMEAIGGTTYKVLLTLIVSVISEDPELYASLQMRLTNMAGIEELFQKRAETWADLVRNKDQQKFVEKMNIVRNGFEKNSLDLGKAYENMYKLVDKL